MEALLCETHGAVLLIRLNRPAALNAINAVLAGELIGVLKDYDADANLRCAVIRSG